MTCVPTRPRRTTHGERKKKTIIILYFFVENNNIITSLNSGLWTRRTVKVSVIAGGSGAAWSWREGGGSEGGGRGAIIIIICNNYGLSGRGRAEFDNIKIIILYSVAAAARRIENRTRAHARTDGSKTGCAATTATIILLLFDFHAHSKRNNIIIWTGRQRYRWPPTATLS